MCGLYERWVTCKAQKETPPDREIGRRSLERHAARGDEDAVDALVEGHRADVVAGAHRGIGRRWCTLRHGRVRRIDYSRGHQPFVGGRRARLLKERVDGLNHNLGARLTRADAVLREALLDTLGKTDGKWHGRLPVIH